MCFLPGFIWGRGGWAEGKEEVSRSRDKTKEDERDRWGRKVMASD